MCVPTRYYYNHKCLASCPEPETYACERDCAKSSNTAPTTKVCEDNFLVIKSTNVRETDSFLSLKDDLRVFLNITIPKDNITGNDVPFRIDWEITNTTVGDTETWTDTYGTKV